MAFFITLFYRCCFVWRTGLSEGTTDSQCHQFTFEQLSDRWCQLHTKTLRTVFKDFNFSLQLPTLNTRDYSLKCIITKFNSANLDGSGPKVLKIEHLTSLLQKKKKKNVLRIFLCFTLFHTYLFPVSVAPTLCINHTVSWQFFCCKIDHSLQSDYCGQDGSLKSALIFRVTKSQKRQAEKKSLFSKK